MIKALESMPDFTRAPAVGSFFQAVFLFGRISKFLVVILFAAPKRRGRCSGVEKMLSQRFGQEDGNRTNDQTSAKDGLL